MSENEIQKSTLTFNENGRAIIETTDGVEMSVVEMTFSVSMNLFTFIMSVLKTYNLYA